MRFDASKGLPDKVLLFKWGHNETVNGPVEVNEFTVATVPRMQKAAGFDTVALDYEHNTVPGSREYNRGIGILISGHRRCGAGLRPGSSPEGVARQGWSQAVSRSGAKIHARLVPMAALLPVPCSRRHSRRSSGRRKRKISLPAAWRVLSGE
jgi:hypothetical protein